MGASSTLLGRWDWNLFLGLVVILGSPLVEFGEIRAEEGSKSFSSFSEKKKFLIMKKSGVWQYKPYVGARRSKEIPYLSLPEETPYTYQSSTPISFPPQPGRSEGLSGISLPRSLPLFSGEKLLKYKLDPKDSRFREPVAKSPPDAASEDLPTVEKPQVTLKEVPQPLLGKIHDMDSSDLKLLQALIFLEIHKSYDLALGLLGEVVAESPRLRMEAQYQLGLAALNLNMRSEFKYRMNQVLKSSSLDWQKKSVTQLVNNSVLGDLDLIPILDPKISSLGLDFSKSDTFHINRAKYYMNKAQLTEALSSLDGIDESSPLYGEGSFLRSTLLYRAGHVDEALDSEEKTYSWLEKNKYDSEIRSMSALTLARMYFQMGRYKEAYQTYLKIDRKHNDWPQAMAEAAWAQILYGDYEGAAGNTFSLHTEFFKRTFAPESYVIRTVGYLNLCQYGDGAKAVVDFRRRYAPIQNMMESYQKAHKNPVDYYSTVKSFLKQSNPMLVVDGLPKYLIHQWARYPAFLDEQRKVNAVEDELESYNKLALGLVQRERDSLKSQSDTLEKQNILKKKLEKVSASLDRSQIQEEIFRQDQNLVSLKIQQVVAKRARVSIKALRDGAFVRLEGEKETYRGQAALTLKDRFEKLFSQLGYLLDQSDILSYELYSQAGEHLRYQSAGGEIAAQDREALKPEDRKQLNWEFRGEIWEDELGSFRSSLKSVCPADDRKTASE